MAQLEGPERSRYVQRMFARIAGRYDLLNRIMTLGQDLRWRREAVRRLELGPAPRVLDVGAGTGDLTLEILRQYPRAHVVAADFTPEMIAIGRRRAGAAGAAWVIADASHLPFAGGAFDGVMSGFLLRNLADLDTALEEQRRALRPGGRLVTLDTTQPSPGPLRPLIQFHLQRVVPLLGRWIAGEAEAYRYLPDSMASFLGAKDLAARIAAAGLDDVGYAVRMLGTVAIHWARREAKEAAL